MLLAVTILGYQQCLVKCLSVALNQHNDTCRQRRYSSTSRVAQTVESHLHHIGIACMQHSNSSVLSAFPPIHARWVQAMDESELDGRTISVTIAASNPVQPGVDLLASSSGGKAAWALQVFNLAWETTEDDLVECFKDCPVSVLRFIVCGRVLRCSCRVAVWRNKLYLLSVPSS